MHRTLFVRVLKVLDMWLCRRARSVFIGLVLLRAVRCGSRLGADGTGVGEV